VVVVVAAAAVVVADAAALVHVVWGARGDTRSVGVGETAGVRDWEHQHCCHYHNDDHDCRSYSAAQNPEAGTDREVYWDRSSAVAKNVWSAEVVDHC